MIYKDGKELKARYYGDKLVKSIYKGFSLVWYLIASCFGSGYWVNSSVWSNKDTWQNK